MTARSRPNLNPDPDPNPNPDPNLNQPDAHGKRPGAPISIMGVLSLVVSFKLGGVLEQALG